MPEPTGSGSRSNLVLQGREILRDALPNGRESPPRRRSPSHCEVAAAKIGESVPCIQPWGLFRPAFSRPRAISIPCGCSQCLLPVIFAVLGVRQKPEHENPLADVDIG